MVNATIESLFIYPTQTKQLQNNLEFCHFQRVLKKKEAQNKKWKEGKNSARIVVIIKIRTLSFTIFHS